MAAVISPISASIKTHARSKLLFNASILAFVASILVFTVSIFEIDIFPGAFFGRGDFLFDNRAYLFFNDGAQIFFCQFAERGGG